MAKEIERKFEVTDPGIIAGKLGSRIIQGYITEQPMTVRVRIIEAESFLAIKSKLHGISRDEYEFPIPRHHARELLAKHCGSCIIEKTRYRIRYKNSTIEVDVFSGRHEGLIIAEIEMSSAEQEIDLPPWLGAELTFDRRFANRTLSMTNQPPAIESQAPMGLRERLNHNRGFGTTDFQKHEQTNT